MAHRAGYGNVYGENGIFVGRFHFLRKRGCTREQEEGQRESENPKWAPCWT